MTVSVIDWSAVCGCGISWSYSLIGQSETRIYVLFCFVFNFKSLLVIFELQEPNRTGTSKPGSTGVKLDGKYNELQR